MLNSRDFDTGILTRAYSRLFEGKPLLVRSPGRVNIIGEHTDYNDGFVLPAAIDKAIYIAIEPRDDDFIQLHSVEFNEEFSVQLPEMQKTPMGWPNYIMGVADQLLKRKASIRGFNMVLGGDVPIGSGLSSSAAVECATVFSLNEIFGLNLSRLDMALIAQKAEHEFAGVMCGIMDQFASVFGKKDHVIKLDCRSLEYEYVPFQLKDCKILLLNTNVKHSLASTEYNIRRKECEQGVAWVKELFPYVKSLRDVTMEMLEQQVKPHSEVIFRRCKFVIEEKERLVACCEDLKNSDIAMMGKKMFRTHDGLSREYEVSCPELDLLVDAVRDNPEVLGARMMGGGFGGCTINIVKDHAIDGLVMQLAKNYREKTGKDLTPYVAEIQDGTGVVQTN